MTKSKKQKRKPIPKRHGGRVMVDVILKTIFGGKSKKGGIGKFGSS